MRIVTDLHVHSKYSRACSTQLTLPNIAAWCAKKGIGLVGTGDFTHPAWFAMMEKELEQQENGLYALRPNPTRLPAPERSDGGQALSPIGTSPSPIRRGDGATGRNTLFVPTVEVSCIYTRGGRGRRVHVILVVPTLEAAKKINDRLGAIGNIVHDGRPILGLDCEELAKIAFDVSPECLVIPAHAWTPWFGVFGSKSGFDSLEECFGTMTKHIHAIETGLSSDPKMNWRLSALDRIALLSFSDAHSLPNLGREATVLDLPEVTYASMIRAIQQKHIVETFEFFPEEGKYHADGHASCGVRLLPEETKKHGGRCPTCKKQVTVGVLSRVADLADRADGAESPNRTPFRSIVPLQEIIAEACGVGKQSKRVVAEYERMIARGGNEFHVLLDAPEAELRSMGSPRIIEGILRTRRGEVIALPGYDGVYGTIQTLPDVKKITRAQQALEI